MVEPKAYAASRSPRGASAKTPRMTEHAIGITIIDTQSPAMNAELTKRDWAHVAAAGSVSTLKIGIQPKYSLIQREDSEAWGIRRKKPQAP